MSFEVPFLTNELKLGNNYFFLIYQCICPRFRFKTYSSAIVILCIVAFVIPRMIYQTDSYSKFLQSPSQMDLFLVDIELIKINKVYLYQIITAIFIHNNYTHFIANLFYSIFMLYQLQYCWKKAPLIVLVLGISVHILAIEFIEGRIEGISSVLCGCLGIHSSVLMLYHDLLKDKYKRTFHLNCIFTTVLCLNFVITSSPAILLHFLGYFLGLIFGTSFYPVGPTGGADGWIRLCAQIVSGIVIIVMVVLLLI